MKYQQTSRRETYPVVQSEMLPLDADGKSFTLRMPTDIWKTKIKGIGAITGLTPQSDKPESCSVPPRLQSITEVPRISAVPGHYVHPNIVSATIDQFR